MVVCASERERETKVRDKEEQPRKPAHCCRLLAVHLLLDFILHLWIPLPSGMLFTHSLACSHTIQRRAQHLTNVMMASIPALARAC